jgi:hypothetical protein
VIISYANALTKIKIVTDMNEHDKSCPVLGPVWGGLSGSVLSQDSTKERVTDNDGRAPPLTNHTPIRQISLTLTAAVSWYEPVVSGNSLFCAIILRFLAYTHLMFIGSK